PPDTRDHTRIGAWLTWLERERGLSFPEYEDAWRWSVTDLDGFWASIWEYFEVRSSAPYERVLGSRSMPGAEWFPGARLNYAERVFHARDPAAVAIRHASELRPLRAETWADFHELTRRIAAALAASGVRPGDRVVAYLPATFEAAAAFHACASLGAVWSSCSPDFGMRSVVDRFAQIGPRVLLTVDGYRYGGRDHDRMEVVRALRAGLPTLERTVVLGYLDPDQPAGRLGPAVTSWQEFLAEGGDRPLEFAQVAFDHPLWVLFSSGTTGLPKAIVHGHGGILLEGLKNLHLHADLRAGDRLFWFTTTGWMMWNYLMAGLLTEASVVLFDGSPGHPDMGALWDLAEAAGISCFGTSAGYLAACMKAGVEPRAGRDLSPLRAVGSTGSPLAPEAFDWTYDRLGPDLWLFSMSGGTDLCTAFVEGVPTLPVHRGELQARALGACVEAWDADGRSVIGEVGELVITRPMPSMPLRFWGDEDGARYRGSYFDVYPGVWRHGDWIEITERGSAVITGRSDATINRGGIRMGTAEIYRAVLALDEVLDALVVDLPREGTQGYMPLFVVLRENLTLDAALIARIRARIREDCSPRHVPDEVRQVAAVPRTLSGKVLELPVKRILSGEPAERALSRDSLADPDAIRPFEELAATPGWPGG
ncbi:MAG TPA: acetoacetate--CoA ligase, partial [Gaiellales bacterium]|nr:acetoacetate--CoA ligase [Gaiellales bacterium]